jgi:polyphosphate kinase
MMHRNLDRRVEVLVKVSDPTAQAQLQAVMDISMDPKNTGWELNAKAQWISAKDAAGKALPDVQRILMRGRDPGAQAHVAMPERGTSG